jgi:hypothetical protein
MSRRIVALVIVGLVAGCDAARAPGAGPATQPSAGPPSLSGTPSPTSTPRPPFAEPPFTAGDTAYNVPGTVKLAAEAFAPLTASSLPTAMRSPDGRYLMYRSWVERPDQSGRPMLRLKDLAGGGDELWADGGNSVAWGADDRIAYVQGGDMIPSQTWTGRVLVRAGVRGPAVAWSGTARRYHVVAWAGRRLLAYQESEGEYLEPLVFDGPGRFRELPDGTFLAISPDGSRALLSGSVDGDSRTRVVDLASGKIVAALRVGDGEAMTEGDWRGDRIVVGGLHGLVVLRMSGRTVAVESTIAIGPEVTPFGPYETQFVDAAGGVVIAWVVTGAPQGEQPMAALRCVLGDRSCVLGPAHPGRSVHPLRNPSRPDR